MVIGPVTRVALGTAARVRSLGTTSVRGRAEPIEAFVLVGLSAAARVAAEEAATAGWLACRGLTRHVPGR